VLSPSGLRENRPSSGNAPSSDLRFHPVNAAAVHVSRLGQQVVPQYSDLLTSAASARQNAADRDRGQNDKTGDAASGGGGAKGAMLGESMQDMETSTAGDSELEDSTVIPSSTGDHGASQRSYLTPHDWDATSQNGTGSPTELSQVHSTEIASSSSVERTCTHEELESPTRHSKGLYHCETLQNLKLEASLRLREQLLCDDAAAVGAFSAQSAAEHSMRVMRHFYEAAMNIKHPIQRRVQDLGAELSPQADALFCSALARCRLAQGNSVSQHDIDVFSNRVNKGLQAIVEELRMPLHLHAKPDEVVNALRGGIEEALYRGYLASPLWNYYRCSRSKEDATIKQLLAKLHLLSPADISRAGVDCSSTEWDGIEVLLSDTAKAKTTLAAAIETAKSIQQWSAPVARLLALQSCSSDVARGLGLQMEEKSAAMASAFTLPSLVFVLIQANVSDIASTNALLSDMLWEGVLAQELGYSAATWDSVTVFLLEQASPSSAGSRPVSGAYEAAAALQLPVPDAARGPGGDNGGGESKLEGGGQGDEDGAAAPAVVGASQAAALPDPVQLTMTLGMSFHETGEEGSSKREAFKRDVANDLAKASGLPAENFKITKLSAGSVIVDIDILPDPLGIAPAPSDVARDLQKQTADPNSPLRSGKLTSQTQVIQVLSPQPTTGAPPPPPTQTIVEERKKVFVRRSLHKSRRPQNETPKFALDANRNMTPLEWEKERYIVRKRRDAHTGTLPCLHACTRAYIHASCVFEYLFRVFALDVHGFP
jgi:hypothetical protein